ncbi:cysteine proteinase inhibitor 6-like [Salvia divinorum]|uniref:Cysteine proteinase inhibitor 6-like n=1 Tax=Salvia divinorum TaxID=28513 RepID=A0ABD1GEF5_SALDI
MASSNSIAASFFGGAVAAKPSAATIHRGLLAVRASMDLEKAVAESSNTRRGLVLAAVAAAAVPSAAMAVDIPGIVLPPPIVPIDPSAPDVLIIGKFAVSEHNKQKKTSLTLESVLQADKRESAGTVTYQLGFSARDSSSGPLKYYLATVVIQDSPTLLKLDSFEPILR